MASFGPDYRPVANNHILTPVTAAMSILIFLPLFYFFNLTVLPATPPIPQPHPRPLNTSVLLSSPLRQPFRPYCQCSSSCRSSRSKSFNSLILIRIVNIIIVIFSFSDWIFSSNERQSQKTLSKVVTLVDHYQSLLATVKVWPWDPPWQIVEDWWTLEDGRPRKKKTGLQTWKIGLVVLYRTFSPSPKTSLSGGSIHVWPSPHLHPTISTSQGINEWMNDVLLYYNNAKHITHHIRH